jgi:predicted N-formylglutamate amidohydrolase
MYDELIISCEHASNRVPARYAASFDRATRWLATHRGYDIGALAVARRFARALDAPLHVGKVTRLLVDLNRSPGHRDQFSSYVDDLGETELERIVARYYLPYRDAIEDQVSAHIGAGRRVLHLTVHSFTAVLGGKRRRADVGLLHDPSRRREAELSSRWQDLISSGDSRLRVRKNYPYTGLADGLIPYLRQRYPASRYLGVEIEMNQRLLRKPGPRQRRYVDLLTDSLVETLSWAKTRQ